MLKNKRIICILFLVVLIASLSLLGTAAFASNDAYDLSYTVGVSTPAVAAGETFTVEVSISANSGIKAAIAQLNYDPDLLTLKNAKDASNVLTCEKGSAFPADQIVAKSANAGTVVITLGDAWTAVTDQGNVLPVYQQTGMLVKLTFEAKSDVTGSADISVEISKSNIVDANGTLTSRLPSYTVNGDSKTVTIYDGTTHTTHTYGEWIEDQPATCVAAGTKHRVCSVCSAVENGIIPAKGHNMQPVAKVDATCTVDGHEAGTKCSRCDVFTGMEKIPAHHDLEEVAKLDPTCTDAGHEAGKKCKKCDYTEGMAVIGALGHDMQTVEKVDATCTEDGHEAGEKCSRCDYFTGMKTIAAHHDMEDVAKLAPTCTDKGHEAGKKCKKCDYTEGMTEIAALGHDMQAVAKVDATCTADGHEAGEKCSRCDHFTGMEKIAAHHTLEDVAKVDATCTVDGHEAGKKCKNCDYTEGMAKIAAKGHTEVVDEAVDPTYFKTGLTEGKHCSVCNEVLVRQTIVDQKSPAWIFITVGAVVVVAVVFAYFFVFKKKRD